jgi:K+-transporting ATPase ATPase A chain
LVWILPLFIVGAAVALSVPVGRLLAAVLDGRLPAPAWLRWVERRLDTGSLGWKPYLVSLLLFNILMFVVAFALLAAQPLAPDWLNPDGKKMLGPTTIFNTTLSFVCNNSLQHYSGEQHLSYFSQLTAIVWSMFGGGATGLCALAAVVRGLRGDKHLGNYYVDMWRVLAYVLLPLSLIVGVLLLAGGVPMTFDGAQSVATPDGGGQLIARGPAAALVPIKNLASVGAASSAPTPPTPSRTPTPGPTSSSACASCCFPAPRSWHSAGCSAGRARPPCCMRLCWSSLSA